MRVLFVTEQFPYPLHDGGNLRTYYILNGLAKEHDVTLISHDPANTDATQVISQICRVSTVPKTNKWTRVGSNLCRFGLAQPLFLLRNRSQRLLERVDRVLNSEHFDVIHLNHLDTACFAAERNWSQAMVFDSHNCLSDLAAKTLLTTTGAVSKPTVQREHKLLAKCERAVCQRMDLTLACSAQEQESFARLCPTGQCDVIPNGVDISYFTPGKDDEEQPGVVVFTGAMGYWPNEQAAIYFCQEVLPVFRGKYSSTIKVYFVGKAPSSRVQSLHNGDNVIVTGEVSDVRPYLRAAQVVIVPLQHGAGTRLKILEAFAMGKAVVSTSLGVEGIPATHEREILIADTPEIFAAQVTRLLQVESLRHRLGHSARRFVTEHFSWPSIQQRLLDAYRDLPMPHKHLCYA